MALSHVALSHVALSHVVARCVHVCLHHSAQRLPVAPFLSTSQTKIGMPCSLPPLRLKPSPAFPRFTRTILVSFFARSILLVYIAVFAVYNIARCGARPLAPAGGVPEVCPLTITEGNSKWMSPRRLAM